MLPASIFQRAVTLSDCFFTWEDLIQQFLPHSHRSGLFSFSIRGYKTWG